MKTIKAAMERLAKNHGKGRCIVSEQVKWIDEHCHVCGKQLNSWDAKCSKALAYKNKTCECCIAKEYDMGADKLRENLESFFGLRPCMGI